MVDGKSLITSKQFWLSVIGLLISIVASPLWLNIWPDSAAMVGVIGSLLTMIVRILTDMPITGVFRA